MRKTCLEGKPKDCNGDCLNCIFKECLHDSMGTPVFAIRGLIAKEYRNIDYLATVMIAKNKLAKGNKDSIRKAVNSGKKICGSIIAKPEVEPTFCSYHGKYGELIVRKRKEGYYIYDGFYKVSPAYRTVQIAQMVLDAYCYEHECKVFHIFNGEIPKANVCIL